MKYFKTYQLFVTLLLLGLFLGGCSPTIQTGYLRDYDKLHEGKYLQNYWSNTTLIGKKKYSKIQVERIAIDRISNQEGVTAKDSKEWLRDGLIKAARASGTPIVFESRPDGAQARMEISITQMTPGSAAGRIFAGELGMGHASVQVEGLIVDMKSREEVVAFSDRRFSSAAIGFRDFSGDAGPTLVREMLEQIAADIMQELKGSFGY